jgi:hypothetical protein
MRIALAAVVAFGLVFGAASAKELPPIKTIGIISDVGDTIRLQHIGFMVFSNSLDEHAWPEWQIDKEIAADLAVALKDRFDLRGVTFAPGSIRPELQGLFWNGPSPKKNVRDHASPTDGQPVDAYLVVWPMRRDLAYPSNQQVEGLGLLTGSRDALLFASIAVTLVDGRSFDEIDECWLKAPVPGHDTSNFLRLDNVLAGVETFDAMTPEQRKAFETDMKSFVREGLSYCLGDLKLH